MCHEEGYYYELWSQERLSREMLEREVAFLRQKLNRVQRALGHVELGMVMYEAELASYGAPECTQAEAIGR